MSLISKIAAPLIVLLTATTAAAQNQGARPPVVIQKVIDDALQIMKPKADEEALARIEINIERAIVRQAREDRLSELIKSFRSRRGTLSIERRQAHEAAVDKVEVDFEVEQDDLVPLQEVMILPEYYFEMTVYGSRVKAAQWPTRMEQNLENRLRHAQSIAPLTQAEIVKLRLAAKGDLKHLQDEVDEARSLFEETDRNFSALDPVMKILRFLHIRILNGPFGDDSLFVKTLEGIRRKQRETSADVEKKP